MDNKERTLKIGGTMSPTAQALSAAIGYATAVEAWPKARAEWQRLSDEATEITPPVGRATGTACFPAKNFGGQEGLCDMVRIEATLALKKARPVVGGAEEGTLSGALIPKLLSDLISKFPNGEITSDPVRSNTQRTLCPSEDGHFQVELFVRVWLDTSETERRLADRNDNPPELI